MNRESRGISTVADVSMALLLVTASVAVFVIFQGEEQAGGEGAAVTDGERTLTADRMAETLSSATISVEYELDKLKNVPKPKNRKRYSRVVQATPMELLADAAVSEIRIDGTSVVNSGNFEHKVDITTRNLVQGEKDDFHVVAIWRPHPGSSIEGTATAGRRPPADADVSSARMTVSSGIPAVADGDVEAGFAKNGYEGAARPIARAIVEGYFPNDASQTQFRLEQAESFARNLTVKRYDAFGKAVGMTNGKADYPKATGIAPALTGNTVLHRRTANAKRANEKLREELKKKIKSDLQNEFGSSATGAEIANEVSTGEVTIIVRTW